MPKQRLLVLTGPVGGGKSTTAVSLAECLRDRGLTTAVVDLDHLYRMGRQHPDEWDEPEITTAARRGSAALAESFFASGLNAVIVEGEFFTAEELKELKTCVRPHVDVRFFTLVVSQEETLRRARGDPSREVTGGKWYGRMHQKFVSSLPFLREASVCIETDSHPPEQIAAQIADRLSMASKRE